MRKFTRDRSLRALTVSLFAAVSAVILISPVSAARLENRVAVFSGIDKITGRITSFDVYIDETVQFGALQVTPKVCYSRDQTEAQKIDAFIEVDEITLDRKIRRIFTGWMFAESPGLNAVEHPVYDVWLTECKMQSDVPPPQTTSVSSNIPRCFRSLMSAAQGWSVCSHCARISFGRLPCASQPPAP